MIKEIRGHENTKFDIKTNIQDSQSFGKDSAVETLTSYIKDQEFYNSGAAIG